MKPIKTLPPTRTPFGSWLDEQNEHAMKFKQKIDKTMSGNDKTKVLGTLANINSDLDALKYDVLRGEKKPGDMIKRISKAVRRIDWLITCLLTEAVKVEKLEDRV